MLLAADPEPRRASDESSDSVKSSPAALDAASAAAAQPEAEDASPVARLKLFFEWRIQRCVRPVFWRIASRMR